MDAGQGATEAISKGLGRRVAVVVLLGVAGLAYFLVLLGSWFRLQGIQSPQGWQLQGLCWELVMQSFVPEACRSFSRGSARNENPFNDTWREHSRWF